MGGGSWNFESRFCVISLFNNWWSGNWLLTLSASPPPPAQLFRSKYKQTLVWKQWYATIWLEIGIFYKSLLQKHGYFVVCFHTDTWTGFWGVVWGCVLFLFIKWQTAVVARLKDKHLRIEPLLSPSGMLC